MRLSVLLSVQYLMGWYRMILTIPIITYSNDHAGSLVKPSPRAIPISHNTEVYASSLNPSAHKLERRESTSFNSRAPIIWRSFGSVRIAITELRTVTALEDRIFISFLLGTSWRTLQDSINKPGNTFDTVIPNDGQVLFSEHDIGGFFGPPKTWVLRAASVAGFQTTYLVLQNAVTLLTQQMAESGYMTCAFEIFDGQTRVSQGFITQT